MLQVEWLLGVRVIVLVIRTRAPSPGGAGREYRFQHGVVVVRVGTLDRACLSLGGHLSSRAGGGCGRGDEAADLLAVGEETGRLRIPGSAPAALLIDE